MKFLKSTATYAVICWMFQIKNQTEKEKKFMPNPYLPSWEYIPDGEPRVFGNRVYVYGSQGGL